MRAIRRIGDRIQVRTAGGETILLEESAARQLMDVDAQIEESTKRRRLIPEKVAAFPIEEHALDLFACGGQDMRAEAEALANLIQDFARRMIE